MYTARVIIMSLLTLNISSEFLHATAKEKLIHLEAKPKQSELQDKSKELVSTRDSCSGVWWDNRCN